MSFDNLESLAYETLSKVMYDTRDWVQSVEALNKDMESFIPSAISGIFISRSMRDSVSEIQKQDDVGKLNRDR